MSKSTQLAVIIDPKELYPPSDQQFLDYLKYSAKNMKMTIDFLTLDSIDSLKKYSSVFLRTLTSRENITYQWVYLANYLKIKSIDTPQSIMLGTDKHLQYELCKMEKIRVPKTIIIYKNLDLMLQLKPLKLTFPLVLKLPNSSFSKGVFKILNFEELLTRSKKLFKTKECNSLIMQEYLYTPYDWRIGILNKKPLFACKYFMAENHWQIFKYDKNKIVAEGHFETLSLKAVPRPIAECIHSVTKIIDNGLYGVDIKLYQNKAYLVEINDNPNIYYGIEDLIDKDNIYQNILATLKC